jgi:hypothetical protein
LESCPISSSYLLSTTSSPLPPLLYLLYLLSTSSSPLPPPLEVTTPTSRAVVVHDLLDVIATDQTGLTVHQHVVSIFTEEEEEEEEEEEMVVG